MREGGEEGGLQREVKNTLKLPAWKSMRMTDSVLPVAMEYKSLIYRHLKDVLMYLKIC